MEFESIFKHDVPKGKDGKHKKIVMDLLSDLAQLSDGSAIRIPLSDLPDSKETVRSVICRATRQKGIEIATSSDAEFLYIWKIQSADDKAAD